MKFYERATTTNFEALVGPDVETITHSNGSKESRCRVALDCTPGALLIVGQVLQVGEDKYGSDQNWRGIPARQHLRHATAHIFAYLAGDRSEPGLEHLAHAACRLLFAIEVSANE